jgi:hypothetical protein
MVSRNSGSGSEGPFQLVGVGWPGRSNQSQFKHQIRIRRVGHQVILAVRFQGSRELGISSIGNAAEGLWK